MAEERGPRDVAGMVYYQIDEIEVAEWSPHSLGEGGSASQVVMLVHVKGLDAPLLVRYKSPRTITELIDALTHHRDNVWPDARRQHRQPRGKG